MALRFEWDDAKATLNAAKHGVTFEDAITIFADPLELAARDKGALVGRESLGFDRRDHDRPTGRGVLR